jgi:murein DD-endopeptidase MepM/ murein hydrolase activator NlpD
LTETSRADGLVSWAVALLGACILALAVIAVAHAALPGEIGLGKAAAAPAPAEIADEPPAEPEAPPFLAFGEPVPGRKIISPWGLRKLPWEDHGRLHEGVDIAADAGARVLAVAEGVVVARGVAGGYGNYIEVKHPGGLTSFYAHLGSVDRKMKVGRRVAAGTPIARIGNGGTSTGPHLHLEIRNGDEPINPILFLNRRFATPEDLPVEMAEAVSPRVRIATVSTIPESKRALMEAKIARAKARSRHGRLPPDLRLAQLALQRSAE